MIDLLVQECLVKETWSFCGINRKNPWGQGNLILCGVKHVLEKGAYELVDYEGIALVEPRNGLYLKKMCMIFSQGYLLYIIVQLCIVRSFSYRDRVCD